MKAPVEGGGAGTERGFVISGLQFQIPPAVDCRSKTVTSRPASRKCRAAGVPDAPDPTTATLRMGWSNVWWDMASRKWQGMRKRKAGVGGRHVSSHEESLRPRPAVMTQREEWAAIARFCLSAIIVLVGKSKERHEEGQDVTILRTLDSGRQ